MSAEGDRRPGPGRPPKQVGVDFATSAGKRLVRRFADEEDRRRGLDLLRRSGEIPDGIPHRTFDHVFALLLERLERPGQLPIAMAAGAAAAADARLIHKLYLAKTFDGKPVRAITTEALVTLRTEISARNTQWHKVRSLLGKVIALAKSEQWFPLDEYPFAGMPRPRRDRTRLVRAQQKLSEGLPMPSLQTTVTLIREAEGWLKLAMMFLLYAGLRTGELREVRKKDVKLLKKSRTVLIHVARAVKRGGYIGVPKREKSVRDIRVQGELYDFLEAYLPTLDGKEALLFHVGNGVQLGRLTLYDAMMRLQVRVGIGSAVRTPGMHWSFPGCYGPHELRHACAARWIWQKVPHGVMQKWLGHKYLSETLDTYGYLIDARLAGDSEWPAGGEPTGADDEDEE